MNRVRTSLETLRFFLLDSEREPGKLEAAQRETETGPSESYPVTDFVEPPSWFRTQAVQIQFFLGLVRQSSQTL